jgi:hypothetical protein
MTRRGGGRDRWVIPTLVLFVGLPVGLAVAQAFRGSSSGDEQLERLREDRTGSSFVAPAGAPLLPAREPASYDITYALVDTSREPVSRSNERRQVRRPFHARVTTRDGDVVGRGALLGQRISNPTSLATAGRDNRWLLLEIGPALATSDLRFGPALDLALAEGDLAVRERRRVQGRTCQVFRAGSSVQAGNLTPYEPGSSSWADVCIDEAGLVLEEIWTIDGVRAQRRLAVDVKEDVELDDRLFELPADATEVPTTEGGGSATPLTLDSRPPGAFYELPPAAVPEGLSLTGRYALVTPRLEIQRDPTSAERPSSTTSVVSVYEGGPDLLVIDQGSLTGSADLPEAPTSRPVDLGLLGQGTAFTDFRTNEVRVVRGSEFVRISGTLPLERLLEVARRLTVAEGGTLTPLAGG